MSVSNQLLDLLGDSWNTSRQWLADRGKVASENWVGHKYRGTSIRPPENLKANPPQAGEYSVQYPFPGDVPLAHTSHFLSTRTPLEAGGLGIGGLVVNNALGNPLGGTADALTLGLTNFRADDPVISEVDVPLNDRPRLGADDVQKEIDRLEKNMAVNAMTLNELKRTKAYLQTDGQVY